MLPGMRDGRPAREMPSGSSWIISADCTTPPTMVILPQVGPSVVRGNVGLPGFMTRHPDGAVSAKGRCVWPQMATSAARGSRRSR